MAQNVTKYNLLISCPSDIKDELGIINEVVNHFNDSFGDVLGITIQIRHWGKSAYAASGGKPQDILNQQFVKNCDAAVAIFWTRFGTPTDEHGSGTEEEIEILLAKKKQVFMYFSDVPASPSTMDSKQFKKVQAFRKKFENRGLYFAYDSTVKFKEILNAHLIKYFLTLKEVETLQTIKTPHLHIKVIQDKNFVDEFSPQPFETLSQKMEAMLDEIKTLYKKIADFHIPNSSPIEITKLGVQMNSPVTIEDSTKLYINNLAEQLEFNLPEDFFYIGRLSRPIGSFAGINNSLLGSREEKQKYNYIVDLKNKLKTFTCWIPFEKEYLNLDCIRLAIQNDGTTFDEDIEVTLIFHENSILLPLELPYVKDFDFEKVENEICELFDIARTVHFLDFESTLKPGAHYYEPHVPISPIALFGSQKSDEEKFRESIDEAFMDYEFFPEGGEVIVKLNLDYLKHNSIVAFPTVLFVKKECKSIDYVITSKHYETSIKGVLKAMITE